MLIHNKYKIYAIYIKNISLRKIEEINWCIKPTLLKIHVQVVPWPVEQLYLSFFYLFHLAKVLKLISEVLQGKKINSQVSTIDKTAKISTSINPNLLKIELQVVSDPLNNFT